jgi:hypothetical protein
MAEEVEDVLSWISEVDLASLDTSNAWNSRSPAVAVLNRLLLPAGRVLDVLSRLLDI